MTDAMWFTLAAIAACALGVGLAIWLVERSHPMPRIDDDESELEHMRRWLEENDDG